MKKIIKIKILNNNLSNIKLLETIKKYNQACDYISKICFEKKIFNQFKIHHEVYYKTRNKFKNLKSESIIRCISKVCDSYKINKTKKSKFKLNGSISYDSRILRFININTENPLISISTTSGRLKLPIHIGKYFKKFLPYLKGESKLIYKKGEFYLHSCIDIPESTPIKPKNILGLDLGVKNILVDSTGKTFSNSKIEEIRKKTLKLRSTLQSKNTKSSKRKLKKISGRERNFRTNENHCISKYLVQKAKGTDSAIALEDLKHINQKTASRKKNRAERLSWSFYQLREFITYKSKLSGVSVIIVDPKNTSRTCSICGYCNKNNRKNQNDFICKECGYKELADYNAAKNIRNKGLVSISLMSSVKE